MCVALTPHRPPNHLLDSTQIMPRRYDVDLPYAFKVYPFRAFLAYKHDFNFLAVYIIHRIVDFL